MKILIFKIDLLSGDMYNPLVIMTITALTVGQSLLSALYAFKKFALQSNSMSLFCYYSHFTEEATDKQRG